MSSDPFAFIELVSVYIHDLFLCHLSVILASPSPPNPIPHLSFSSSLIRDAEVLAHTLAQAFTHTSESFYVLPSHVIFNIPPCCAVIIPWDASHYSEQVLPGLTGFNDLRESQASEHFPPLYSPPYPLVQHPATVLDSQGRILVWYLPNGFTPERQVSIKLFSLMLCGVNHGVFY